MNTCETCRYYMSSPLQEPCESCYWDGVIGHDPPNWKGPTNADRIRAMSDEELAEWIMSIACCYDCRIKVCDCNDSENNCRENWLDWLRQEVSDGETP